MKFLEKHLGDFIVGLALLLSGAFVIEPWRDGELSLSQWRVWIFLGVIAFAVVFWVWRSRKHSLHPGNVRAPSEGREKILKQRRDKVHGNDHDKDFEESHGPLHPIEIALMRAMVTNPPLDRAARGFAVDLGIWEGQAEFYLENLVDRGFFKRRGFVAGGGYELTQAGRRYAIDHGFI